MGYVARYTRGQYILDISSGVYSLLDGFQPPTTIEAPNFASGTSANRAAGSQLVSRRAVDRDFSFQVLIDGDSTAEGDMAVEAIDAFLRMAGDEDEPVYFEWRPDNNVAAEPLWGQFGAYRRVKVLSGGATKGGIQSSAQADGKHVARVTQTIAPYALGQRQRLAQATGPVLEHRLGRSSAIQGTVIGPGSGWTNYFANPVFGHPTWNNGWTASNADLQAEQNLNDKFTLFGLSSALLTGTNATLARQYYESVNVGSTATFYLGCYVKRPDGAAVTSADCQLYYGSAQATTYRSVGNGWYILTCTVTGVAAGTNTGIQVAAKHSIYVDAFFINIGTTYFWYGDFPGCTWSGTAHASTSVLGTPYMRIPVNSNLNMSYGTIRIVTEAFQAAADIISSGYLVHDSSGNLKLYFDFASNAFVIGDGTTTDTTAAQTFVAGDRLVFHLCWDPDGMILYINGVATSADMAYKPPTPATYLYLGSHNTGGSDFMGIFKECATYGKKMTSTEVLADYNNIVEAITDESLSPIPFEWTKDGDSVIDLSNIAATDNYALIAGIPGSAPADTIIHATLDTAGRALILANNPFDRYLDMDDTFVDRQGTVIAAALSGEVERLSVNTTEVEIPASTRISIADNREAYYNKAAYVYVSLADAGANLRARLKANFTTDLVLTGDYQSITTDASLRNFLIGPLRIPYGPERQFEWVGASSTLNFYVGFIRSTAGAANVDFDFYQLLVGQIAYIVPAAANVREYLIREGRAWAFNSGATQQRETPEYRGDPIRFEPGKINHLTVMSKAHGTLTTLNATVTLTRAYIIPRYTIL